MRVSALVLAAAAAALLAAGAAGRGSVLTIEASVLREPNSFFRQAWLRGVASQAPSGAAVEILVRECRATAFREAAGARVTPSRTWETRLAVWERTEYRARWGRELSPVVSVVPPILPAVEARPRGRFDVSLYAESPRSSFAGRPVVLQRLAPGGWVDVRTSTLKRGPDLRTFVTTFVVRTRGLTLRVLAPHATVRPCFRAGASAIFRS
jgi:hypothetical protein